MPNNDQNDGTTIVVPQPMKIEGGATSYPSREALIADIAIRLFLNTNFDVGGKSVDQCAKDALVRARVIDSVDRKNGNIFESLIAK